MTAATKALASKREAHLAEARTLIALAKREHRGLSPAESMRAEDLIDEAKKAQRQIQRLEGADRTADHIIHDAVEGGGLLAEFKAAGWRPGERTYIDDPGFRAGASFSGNVEEISPVRVEGAPLGIDARYIAPAFPQQAVGPEVTSVQVLLQSARTLADPEDVIRDIDAVTAKPETSSVKTLQEVPLHQVASIESGTPNIILAQPGFRSMVETDLRSAILHGYDLLILDAVEAVSPTFTPEGADLVASLRQAMEDLAALGYDGPYTALLSPEDAVALDLMQTEGPEAFYQFGIGQFASSPFGLSVRVGKSVTSPMVVDPAAFGRLYATGLTLASFEEEAGATNSSTVRLEGNAAFGVEREAALTIIGETS